MAPKKYWRPKIDLPKDKQSDAKIIAIKEKKPLYIWLGEAIDEKIRNSPEVIAI
jgi:hypothetical protein